MSIQCIQCIQDINEKEPWMTIRDESSGPEVGPEVGSGAQCSYLCSYLCYRKGRDKYPKNLWSLVQNKEDFQGIRPTQTLQLPEKSFQFLRHDDLLQLSDAEVDHYYDNLRDQVALNPQISVVQEEEEEREDRRIRELEEEWETGSGSGLQGDDF